MAGKSILIFNSGSSSLKLALMVEQNGEGRVLLDGSIQGVGRGSGVLKLRDANGGVLKTRSIELATQAEALDEAVRCLRELPMAGPDAVGHRVVHGGPRLLSHQRITPAVIAEIQACSHLAPLHISNSIELINRATRAYPDIPQFACFDTVFHATMPEAAARFALPRELFDEGIRRYGFHGLSYESIIHEMGESLPDRTVIAHLGNGASLAAVKGGRSVDTTMGLTPAGGIPMATRSGDIDPGVLLYLLRRRAMSVDALEKMLNLDSGLVALSAGKCDMRDLEAAAQKGDRQSQLAIEVFCLSIGKVIAGYAAVLGGLDMVIFSGGIGEHSARVRSKVCETLAFLGVSVDETSNQMHGRTISCTSSKVHICVVASQEERQIARHCYAMMRGND